MAEGTRALLLLLAGGGALVGLFELSSLYLGRRQTLPGYGWETEATHLAMNIVMGAMLLPVWSAKLAAGSGILLCAAAGLLAIAAVVRVVGRSSQRGVIVTATAIHVFAALLMAAMVWRMAPRTGGGMAGMAMGMARRSSWDWAASAFFLFDLASVLLVTALPHRFVIAAPASAPRLSIWPHVAMDVGMIAMLLLL